ncbi:hypothetical protein JAAARDRAFT_211374 [Jaapia argillacea MUCL 33604]|uniref:F-box domain-containing protein n=1 Tax=Jaapia argillacea MUCL 33604 TaxID=933084 RepID=A0A067P8J5_9AGAM|nr:hypothetical protein JAAARDRAFT_211374 [Jaapia argillacea MUCL 33604]
MASHRRISLHSVQQLNALSILHLPSETLLDILRFVSIRDLFNCRTTCKTFHTITDDRQLWYSVLSATLSVPIRHIHAVADALTSAELRRRALRASMMKDGWRREQATPLCVQTYPWNTRVQDIRLVPGGEWMVCLLDDGTLQLYKVGQNVPAFVVPFALDIRGYTKNSIFISESEFQLLLHCNVKLYIYQVNIHHQPSLRLLSVLVADDLAGVSALRNATIGGNLLGVDCYHDGGDLIYMKTLRAAPDGGGYSHVGMIHDSRDCVLHLLSPTRILSCNTRGMSVFKIPPMRTTAQINQIVTADRVWHSSFSIVQPGTLQSSPGLWNRPDGQHDGPLVLLGPGVLHIIVPSLEVDNYEVRTFPMPQILSSHIEVGVLHALCPQREPRHGLIFRMCTFPKILKGDGVVEPLELHPDHVVVGSFVVNEFAPLHALSCSFDEWTGRVCLLLQDPNGRRRVAIVDVL